MSTRRFGREEATGYLYVFFQSADFPMNPSYITYDTDAMAWGDPITLPMTLHEQEGGIYKSSPQAVYFNNQIFLFGRGPDDRVQVMTMSPDGSQWSDPLSLDDRASNGITPCVWNNSLYIFYPSSNGNRLSCSQYDENLKRVNAWVSSNSSSPEPVAVIPANQWSDYIKVYYQDDSSGTLKSFEFAAQGFPSGSTETGIGLSNGPCALPLKSRPNNYVFYRSRVDSTMQVYDAAAGSTSHVDRFNTIDGRPSTVLFDDEGPSWDMAAFYVQPDRKLKAAGIQDIPGYPPAFTVVTIEDTGATLAETGCYPFVLAIS